MHGRNLEIFIAREISRQRKTGSNVYRENVALIVPLGAFAFNNFLELCSVSRNRA